MTDPQKRYVVRNLTLKEISSVDKPAQTGAVSVLMKAAVGDAEYVAITKNAADVVEKAVKPSFTTLQYENALLQRAALLAQTLGITPEKALAINLTSDSIMRELATAMEHSRFGAAKVGLQA